MNNVIGNRESMVHFSTKLLTGNFFD